MKRFVVLVSTLLAVFFIVSCGSAVVEKNTIDTIDSTETSASQIQEESVTAETEDSSGTISETPSVPEDIPEPGTPAWKEAYLNLLETMKDYHRSYALVFVDNDDIPELYLNGNDEATGDGIYSYINGSVIEQRLRRTWGGRYIERSGELYNSNGAMGGYTTHAYRLTAEGFSQTFYASIIEKIKQEENNEPVLSYEYFVEDVLVSETEYNNATNAAFDQAKSKSFHENAVTYDVIKEQIKGF